MPETGKGSAETWAEFIDNGLTRKSMNNAMLAAEVGVNRATVGNWRRGLVAAPKRDLVRAVAAALGTDPEDALVAAGILQPGDQAPGSVRPISDYSGDELLDELRARLHDAERRAARAVAGGIKRSAASRRGDQVGEEA